MISVRTQALLFFGVGALFLAGLVIDGVVRDSTNLVVVVLAALGAALNARNVVVLLRSSRSSDVLPRSAQEGSDWSAWRLVGVITALSGLVIAALSVLRGDTGQAAVIAILSTVALVLVVRVGPGLLR